MEVAPGIHRIEGDLGERYVCQYLLVGDERTLLVDTGLRDMPAQVIAPYLATLGRSLADLDDVLISHADVDHCGGNRALRAAAPDARLLCGEADRAWIESNAAMLAGNYLLVRGLRLRPVARRRRVPDARAGRRRAGRRRPARRRDAAPGPGLARRGAGPARPHARATSACGTPRSGAAIIIDAVLADGVYDRAGNRLIPPRYYSAAAYEATIRRLRALDPALLLTAHYDVMERDGGARRSSTARSPSCTRCATRSRAVQTATTALWPLTQEVDAAVGPFPAFTHELAASVRAHLART